MKRILKHIIAFTALSLTVVSNVSADRPPVQPADASQHFAAVSRHLDLGGLFFSYVDVDGDLARIAAIGDRLLDLARKQENVTIPGGLNARQVLDTLGLTTIKAIGLSSRAAGKDLYHNRALIYTPGGAKGLMKLAGSKAAPFAITSFAPKDTDLAAQFEINLGDVIPMLEELVTGIGDTTLLNQFNFGKAYPVPGLGMTAAELLGKLNTRIMIIGKIESDKTLNIPGAPIELPSGQLMMIFDGIDFLMQPVLTFAGESDKVSVEKGEGFTIVRPNQSLSGDLDKQFRPALYHDLKGGRIILTTHLDYARAALAGASGLKDSPDFIQAMTGLPSEGNGLTFATSRVTKTLVKVLKEIMAKSTSKAVEGPTPALVDELLKIMEEISPPPNQGLAAVYSNIEEGMLFASNLNENYKHTLGQIAALPAIFAAAAIGASSHIPSLQEFIPGGHDDDPSETDAPEANEAKEIPEKSIRNHLQQIAFAAQTYFIDNPDANDVNYEQLIKAELLVAFDSVSGEKYGNLFLKRKGGSLEVIDDKMETTKFKYSAVTD